MALWIIMVCYAAAMLEIHHFVRWSFWSYRFWADAWRTLRSVQPVGYTFLETTGVLGTPVACRSPSVLEGRLGTGQWPHAPSPTNLDLYKRVSLCYTPLIFRNCTISMAEVCYLQIYVEKGPSQIYSMQNIVSPSARHSHASGLLLQLSGRSHGADQQSRWGLSTPPKLRFHMRIVHIMLHLQGKWDEKAGIMVCMNICIWYTICVSWYVSFLWEHQESIVEKLKSNSCKKRWRHTVKISWLLGCVVQCWSKWGSMKPNVHQNISIRICRTRLGYSLFSCGSCECWQMLPLLDPFSIRLAAPCDAIFTMAGWQSRKRGVWEGSMMFHDVPWSGNPPERSLSVCVAVVVTGTMWFFGDSQCTNPTEFHRCWHHQGLGFQYHPQGSFEASRVTWPSPGVQTIEAEIPGVQSYRSTERESRQSKESARILMILRILWKLMQTTQSRNTASPGAPGSGNSRCCGGQNAVSQP